VLDLCHWNSVVQKIASAIATAHGGNGLDPAQSKSHPDSWRTLNSLTDEQLVTCLLAGEQDALTVLFDRYHKLVFSVAVRIVNDPGEAEEVVQTVFLDFFRGLASFDASKGILKVWLLQYAYHRALNRRRHLSASRFYQWVDLNSSAMDPALSWNPGDVAEVAQQVDQLINGLTPRRREILELTYFDGLTAEEVAARLGVSVNIVRHELYRALAKLREVVTQESQTAAGKELPDGKGALKTNAQEL
jgi:RNA polymerase sigma-70 factor (ECF subfamily)